MQPFSFHLISDTSGLLEVHTSNNSAAKSYADHIDTSKEKVHHIETVNVNSIQDLEEVFQHHGRCSGINNLNVLSILEQNGKISEEQYYSIVGN